MSVRVVKGHKQIESCLHASKEKKKCQGSERGLVNIQLAAGQKKRMFVRLERAHYQINKLTAQQLKRLSGCWDVICGYSVEKEKKISDCVSDSDMALVIKQLEKVIKNVRQESDITL